MKLVRKLNWELMPHYDFTLLRFTYHSEDTFEFSPIYRFINPRKCLNAHASTIHLLAHALTI